MTYSAIRTPAILTLIISAVLLITACSDDKSDPQPESAQAQAGVSSSASGQEQELKDAPNFTLDTMDGDSFTLSEHEGQVVVLNIWATWCPPCRKEIPDFIDIQKEMRAEGVLFVGVSVDKEGWEVVRPFAKEYGINYPLVVDDGTINQKYGPIQSIPTTFIINKKGKVEYVAPGMVNREALQPALKKLANR